MSRWRIVDTEQGLRLSTIAVRGLGSEKLTWADLLASRLSTVQVYLLYFPSRFSLPLDTVVTETLHTFAKNTPPSTSVNFWDPTDPAFSNALGFFDLKTPPSLIFVPGFGLTGMEAASPDEAPLYSIALTEPEVLGDQQRLAVATNTVHEIVARGNSQEITGYLRRRRLDGFLDAIGSLGSGLRDQFLKLKPKVQIPGGFSIQVG